MVSACGRYAVIAVSPACTCNCYGMLNGGNESQERAHKRPSGHVRTYVHHPDIPARRVRMYMNILVFLPRIYKSVFLLDVKLARFREENCNKTQAQNGSPSPTMHPRA